MRGHGRVFRRKHSGSWWISYYHHGQEIRESAKTTSEHKARALLRERLRTAGTQEFIGPAAQRVTFEDLAALYLTDYRLNGRRSLRDATRNVETLRGRSASTERWTSPPTGSPPTLRDDSRRA